MKHALVNLKRKFNGKYSEAKSQYLNYAVRGKNVDAKQKDRWIRSCDSATIWMNRPKPIEIIAEKSLNSAGSDWGAVRRQVSNIYL